MVMNELCPVCGWRFQRETGYFYGAMYASWFFSMATVVPVMIVLLAMRQPAWVILGVTLTQVVVQVPLSFMYGRQVWMYVDNMLDRFPAWEPAEARDDGGATAGRV
jgi:hypothetical protein